MDDYERKVRQRLKDDFIHYAKKCLQIRSKSGEIQPFVLNTPQLYIHKVVEQQLLEFKKIRAIILKGRQEGCSTYVEGRFYWRVTHWRGFRAFILTHDAEATNNLFEMANRYHQYCPSLVKPRVEASNAKELIFAGMDSGYKLGTAGNKGVGRSSTIQLLHGSEVAYWPNASEHAKGILQAVPNEKHTEIFLESTANGVGNYFHQQWQLAEAGQSEFIPIFIPWFWQEEYKKQLTEQLTIFDEEEQKLVDLYQLTPEQINWRRSKITDLSVGGLDGVKSFMQEYPCNATEAFQTTGEDNFITANLVMAARKSTLTESYGHLVIGVDPARFGDDRTSIVFRRGRCVEHMESHTKKDTMEITGLVHKIILDIKPHRVFIDIGGLGAGIYDRLKELGHYDILVAVNGGATPLNQKRYLNKRAEMWGEMKEWLMDVPCKIPDINSLHADLCGIKYKIDSKSRLVMEKKEDMKKRGIRSPDEADALALTFALPATALLERNNEKYSDIAKSMYNATQNIDRLKKKAYE
jgi:hypothetical protein